MYYPTGWKLQIVVIFKIPIFPNYNTYKTSKDCFRIVSKGATKTSSGNMT